MLLSWNTTNRCNLYCAHCYREAGARREEELSPAEGKDLVTEVASAGFKTMIFSGGEPLMREDILELLAWAREKGLRPVLGSNGTLLTASLARRLKEAGAVAVGISLDSTSPAKHDKLRARAGAWEEAVAGMRYCREAGLPFQVHTTVMEGNEKEVPALTELAVNLGASAHHIFFLVPTGRAVALEKELLRAREYEGLIKGILKKQQEVDIELKPTCAPQFMRIAHQWGLSLRFRRGCLAGIAYAIVGPQGEVQPCAYLNLPVGNVREVPFNRLWKESKLFNHLRTLKYGGKCGTCPYHQVCGGCRARAYLSTGDYMGEDPWCLYQPEEKAK